MCKWDTEQCQRLTSAPVPKHSVAAALVFPNPGKIPCVYAVGFFPCGLSPKRGLEFWEEQRGVEGKDSVRVPPVALPRIRCLAQADSRVVLRVMP